jgi:predicted ATPase
MLTRLEVDGFKNLLELQVEFGPFTCIAGANAVGKSNLFDAIEFLSLLAEHSLFEVPDLVRTTVGRGGDPRELFWTDGKTRATTMRFAAEMIVPERVEDDFGRVSNPSTTYMRYELELGYEGPSGLDTLGRLVLLDEKLEHITRDEARSRLRFPHSSKHFRAAVLHGRPTGKHPFIWTEADDASGRVIIQVSQDQHGGRPSPSAANSAKATIVSSTSTTSHPTILAAKREMQAWRQLSLEPTAMRSPDEFRAPRQIATNGAHLTAALYALANRPSGDDPADPEAIYAELTNRIARLIPARSVRVDRDDKRQLLTLELETNEGGFLPARALSDGTLRFLALAVLAIDSSFEGVVCMEEPENGIHPARLEAMVDLVRSLAVDPHEPPSETNPFRQIIVNTHSPGFVRLVHSRAPDDLLLGKLVTVRGPTGAPARTLRLAPIRATWRASDDDPGLDLVEFLDYLQPHERTYDALPGTQLSFIAEDQG